MNMIFKEYPIILERIKVLQFSKLLRVIMKIWVSIKDKRNLFKFKNISMNLKLNCSYKKNFKNTLKVKINF